MELIEIIRTSLIIFTIVSTIFIMISYLGYKLKDRNRIKPYEREINLVSPVVLLSSEEIAAKKEIPQKKEINPRFHILNENPIIRKAAPQIEEEQPVHKLRQRPVISYYSFNKKESMHKLTSSRLADEEI